MNDLQVFNNEDFGQVRTLEEDGQILFCGADVARALGYSNTRDALQRHCKGVVKRDTQTKSGVQEMSFIPESDLYRLAFSSKLPTAEQFTDWVTQEVLPSIRRYGGYLSGQPQGDSLAWSLLSIQRTMDAMNRRLSMLEEQRTPQVRMESYTRRGRPPKWFVPSGQVNRVVRLNPDAWERVHALAWGKGISVTQAASLLVIRSTEGMDVTIEA